MWTIALVVETRDAGNIGDIATAKNRNGAGIDQSNVIILFLFFFIREINIPFYERSDDYDILS